ncbi:MAG: hypothetical protein Q7W56_06650 [Candidatus Latescibacteria bacterium]|nr:hypothetical protein [Candidatus Latescibacterota bacterium]
MDASTIIAIYGAAVATLSVGWHIRRDRQDQGDLRVDFKCLGSEGGEDNHLLLWCITNHGKHPLALAQLGITTRKWLRKNRVLLDERLMIVELPHLIDAGDTYIIETTFWLPPRATGIAAWDTKGRCYKMPHDRFLWIVAAINREGQD